MKLASGDYIDLKMYEPAMRHLIDTYIRAEESEMISAFDDMSLVQLIVERGAGAVDALPKGHPREQGSRRRNHREQRAQAHHRRDADQSRNTTRQMSELLDALIKQRKQGAIDYEKYLAEIVALTKKAKNPGNAKTYPAIINTAKRALYDNLDMNEGLAVALDAKIRRTKKDDWRGNKFKEKEVRNAVRVHLTDPAQVDLIFDLVRNQHEY